MKTYFHISQRPLRVGAVLTQGVFGAKVSTPEFREANYADYIKEMVFDDVRKAEFPTMPSRLDCVFFFPKLILAQVYRAYKLDHQGYIYEIEVEEGTVYTVDMDLLKCNGQEYELMKSNARKYWQQVRHADGCTVECLLDGSAIVKGMVDKPSQIW